MQLNRVELSQKHIECFGIRALSEPYEIVAHHTALQFNLYLDLSPIIRLSNSTSIKVGFAFVVRSWTAF
jgi:hypothetical protein